ncbi:hypothetical protein X975_10566, partial [Stegodyphus mimosarum]
MDSIRPINSSFAFASIGNKPIDLPGPGLYCFQLHGQVCHQTGTLHPFDGKRKFAQLYILDPSEASSAHLEWNKRVPESLPNEMEELFQDINPFASAYKMMHEVEKKLASNALASNEPAISIPMAIVCDRNLDQRRLQVHLPDEQYVCFNPEYLEGAVQRAENKHTNLTAWFELNKHNDEAKKYYYRDIPEHFV